MDLCIFQVRGVFVIVLLVVVCNHLCQMMILNHLTIHQLFLAYWQLLDYYTLCYKMEYIRNLFSILHLPRKKKIITNNFNIIIIYYFRFQKKLLFSQFDSCFFCCRHFPWISINNDFNYTIFQNSYPSLYSCGISASG